MCTSKPKVPAPTPVIERQAYRSPVSRGSLSSGDSDANRRRKLMGVETSAQGITTEASTTKRVRMGGDDSIVPIMGGGGGAPGSVPGSGGDGVPTDPGATPPNRPRRRLAGGPRGSRATQMFAATSLAA